MATPQNSASETQCENKIPGFCATRSKEGTKDLHSKNLEDFLPFVEHSSLAWIDYIIEDVEKDAKKTATKAGFSETLVKQLLKAPLNRSRTSGNYVDLGTEMGLLLPSIHVERFEVTAEPLLILLRKNLVLTMHTRELTHFYQLHRYAGTFFKKLPEKMELNDWLTLLLIRIIDENNSMNFEQVAEIDEASDGVSRDLANPKTSRFLIGAQIYQMKHALVSYLLGLWATVDALSTLRYGDADLLTDNPQLLERVSSLVSEVHAQINLAENLSQVLASGLEVLQSIYANQLQLINNRITLMMGLLTIIGTALLVPNTIATVVSQTNIFTLTSADLGWYLTLIVGSTIVATLFAWWFVKKVGFLPKSPDQQ